MDQRRLFQGLVDAPLGETPGERTRYELDIQILENKTETWIRHHLWHLKLYKPEPQKTRNMYDQPR